MNCPQCGEGVAARPPVELDMDLKKSEGGKKNRNGGTGQRRRIREAVLESGGDLNKMAEWAISQGYDRNVIYIWRDLYGDAVDQQRVRQEQRARQGGLGI